MSHLIHLTLFVRVVIIQAEIKKGIEMCNDDAMAYLEQLAQQGNIA